MAQGGKSKLLGLGFIFGAKDDGAEKKASKLKESFDSLKSSVQSMSQKTASIQKFGNAINALNLIQLTRINNALDGIASQAGALGPRAGDTALESFGIQFNQTFKAATAGMGDFRKEVDKLRPQISGVAHSLQVDGGDILKAVTNVAKTGKSLKDFGLTVRDVGGSIQAGLLGGDKLGELLTGLSEGYDLGAEGATRLIDKITSIGEMAGSGADAIRNMPAAVKAADEIISSLGHGNVEDVTESITRLAVASQQRLGGDFNEAMSDAIAVFNQLGGQKKQLRDLVTGLGSDFPKLAQEIGIASGDIDGALEAATSNPVKFAESLQKLLGQMDPASTQSQRLLASLESMPAGFRFLVTGGEKAAQAIQKAQKPLNNFEGAFSKMARGASGNTRTFGELMELEADRFKTGLNALAGSGSGAIKEMRGAHKSTLGFLKDLTKGAYGPEIAKMSKAFFIFRRQGIAGLVHYAKKEFPGFLNTLESMQTVLKRFGAAWKDKGFIGAIKSTLGPALGDMFTELFEGMGKWIDGVDWGEVGAKIGTAIDNIFSDKNVETGAVHGFEKLMQSIGNAIPAIMSGIWSTAGWKSLIPLLFTGLGKQALIVGTGMLGKAFIKIGSAILPKIGSSFKNVFGAVFKKIGGFAAKLGGAKAIGKFALKKIPFIGPIISLLFDLPDIIEDVKSGNIQKAFLRVFNSVINGLTFGIPDILASMFGMDMIEDIVMPGIAHFNQLFNEGMDILVENAMSMWDKFMGYGQMAFDTLANVFDWFAGLWDTLKKGVVDGWNYIVGGVKDAFMGAFRYVENFFFGLFDKFEGFLLFVKRGFQEIPVFILSTIQSMMSNSVISTMLNKFAGVTGVDVKGSLDRALKEAKQAVSDTVQQQEDLRVRVRDREKKYAQSQAPTRSMGEDASKSAEASLRRQLDRESNRSRQQNGPQHVIVTGHTPKAARELELAHQKGASGARRSAGTSRGSAPGSAGDIM